VGASMSRLLASIESLESRGNPAFLGFLVVLGVILAFGLPVPAAGIVVISAAAVSAVSPSAALGACLAATPLIFRPVSIGDGSWMLLELALIAASIGLARWSFMPASRQARRSSAKALAVRATMGVSSPRSRTWRVAATPSIPGMRMSISTRS